MLSQIVTSKYFARQSGMDESLDFQEKKKTIKGPKVIEKAKQKRSSKPKRIRGQKDIRAVLKKNELITYSKDFNKVCKDSGIDVDPEQLQLAIALSKSLEQSQSNAEDIPSTSRICVGGRSEKIKTTLQEYGFKVPEVKVSKSKSRKLKHPKNYKLLLATDTEKQEIINERFTQILAANIDRVHSDENSTTCTTSNAKLYYVATNIPYKDIKDDNVYYVEGLFDKLPNSVGSLLKDWASIPGRPVTPVIEASKVKFADIECSQEEIDAILSSSVKYVQDFVVNKHKNCFVDKLYDIKPIKDSSEEEEPKMDTEIIEVDCDDNKATKVVITNVNSIDSVIEINEHETMTTEKTRSLSPDLFDDEVSCIMDKSDCNTKVSIEDLKTTNIDNFMDLTTCINVKTASKTMLSQLSQGTDVTKRKSNDFMQITKCLSQPIVVNHFDFINKSVQNTIALERPETNREDDIVKMDLTQSSSSNDSLPFVQISGKDDALDDIIVANNNDVPKETDSLKVQQSLNNTEDLILTDTHNSQLGNTEIVQVIKHTTQYINECSLQNESNVSHVFNLKESLNIGIKENKECSENINDMDNFHTENRSKNESGANNDIASNTQSFFEEFNHPHSDDEVKDNYGPYLCPVNNDEINDLSHSSDSSVEITGVNKDQSTEIKSNIDSLGKIGNVSIDYDEMFDELEKEHSTNSNQGVSSKENTVSFNAYEKSVDCVDTANTNCSQRSEVFEISDNELGYSMHKSKIYEDNGCEEDVLSQNISQEYTEDINTEPLSNNFEIGGLSIMDNLSNLRSSKSNCFDSNAPNNDSHLPVVNLKGTDVRNKSISPIKSNLTPLRTTAEKPIAVKTPKNGEFIVKTEQVTPAMDYESLNTPERNKELEKYGLKPFKRKRAIQLLNHLYNQTHPLVESCEDIPSTLKKLKPSISPQKCHPIKQNNYDNEKKCGPSMSLLSSQNEGNSLGVNEMDIYDVTTDTPDIRTLECAEEDWIFQKREKAKVHSCRVPLHISLHNYVSCRGFLRAAILRYEPVNIEILHKGLVANGCRYDPKDLLKFMDKKCITVKTSDNNSRNKKHY